MNENQQNSRRKNHIIRNIIIVAIIMAIAFFSQQAYFKASAKKLFSEKTTQGGLLKKADDWVRQSIYPMIKNQTVQEAEKRGVAAKEELTQQKNNFIQNILQNTTAGIEKSKENISNGVKNFISEKIAKPFCPQPTN